MTKEIILRTELKREPGYLYYCGTDEFGKLYVGRAVMKRGGGRKKKELEE